TYPARSGGRSRRSGHPPHSRSRAAAAWLEIPARPKCSPIARCTAEASVSKLFLPEIAICHYLAALHQTMLLGTVVRDRVVDRADVLPNEHVALFPMRGVDVLRLQLVLEEILQH